MRQNLSFTSCIVALCLLVLVAIFYSQQEVHLSEVINLSRSTPIKLKQFKRDQPFNESEHKTVDENQSLDIKSTIKTSSISASKKKEEKVSSKKADDKTIQFIPSTTTKEHTHIFEIDISTSMIKTQSTITYKPSGNEKRTSSSRQTTNNNSKNTEIDSRSAGPVKSAQSKKISTGAAILATTATTVQQIYPSFRPSSSTKTSSKSDSMRISTQDKDNKYTSTADFYGSTLKKNTYFSSSTTIKSFPNTTAREPTNTSSSTATSISRTRAIKSISGIDNLFHHKTDDHRSIKSLSKSKSSSTLSPTITQTQHSSSRSIDYSGASPMPTSFHTSESYHDTRPQSKSLSAYNTKNIDYSSSFAESANTRNMLSGGTTRNETASYSTSINSNSTTYTIYSNTTKTHTRTIKANTDSTTILMITVSSISDHQPSASDSVTGHIPKPTATLVYNNNSTYISTNTAETAATGDSILSPSTNLKVAATSTGVKISKTLILTTVDTMSTTQIPVIITEEHANTIYSSTTSTTTPTTTTTTTTTTTDTTTTTTTYDQDQYTYSPSSVYQYVTLTWLSEPFSYNAHTNKKTKESKPTTTPSFSHNNSISDNDSSSDIKNTNDSNDESGVESNESTSGSKNTTKSVKTTKDDKDDKIQSQKEKKQEENEINSHPEYITPNIGVIIPQTSSIAYLRFHTLSYNTLVSDSLLTAQFVQALPLMISSALNISPNDVIFLTITSEKNSDNIESLFRWSIDNGIITAFAIPSTEIDELDQLVQTKNSSLYLPANEQIVSMLDQTYPITGYSALGDPNDPTKKPFSDNNQGNSRLPKSTVIGICVGVGIVFYASATMVGIKVYKRHKQRDREQHEKFTISSPIMQSNSLGWQVYPPEDQLYKV